MRHYHSIPNNHGRLRAITGTNPAAGANIQELQPANTRWRLIQFQAILTTAVAVANRNVHLNVVTNNTVLDIYANLTQVASQAVTYQFLAGGPDRNATLNGVLNVQLPLDFWFNGTGTINLEAAGIQAADDWATPSYYIEEWIEE